MGKAGSFFKFIIFAAIAIIGLMFMMESLEDIDKANKNVEIAKQNLEESKQDLAKAQSKVDQFFTAEFALLTPVFAQEQEQEQNTFLGCYTSNVAAQLFGAGFTPFTIDTNDPKFKEYITEICNFYYEKTGRWLNGFDFESNTTQYDKELMERLTVKDKIPDSIQQILDLAK